MSVLLPRTLTHCPGCGTKWNASVTFIGMGHEVLDCGDCGYVESGTGALSRYPVTCCPCGARAYSLAELVDMANALGTRDGRGWALYWPSVLGPHDLYCAAEDETLTEIEACRARGLNMRGHDLDEFYGRGHFTITLTGPYDYAGKITP